MSLLRLAVAVISSVALVSALAGCGGHHLDAKKEVQTWWEAKRIVDSCDKTGDMWHTSTVYACQTHDPNGIRGGAEAEHGYYGLRWDSMLDEFRVTALCRNSVGELREHRAKPLKLAIGKQRSQPVRDDWLRDWHLLHWQGHLRCA